MSNATMAQAVHHLSPVTPMPLAGQDQTGNAAVAKAALHAVPIVPVALKADGTRGR
ncbi:hypothetical protein ACWDR3_15935 [Streptomyces sp. NPDC001002]